MSPNPLMKSSGARLVLVVSTIAVAVAGVGTLSFWKLGSGSEQKTDAVSLSTPPEKSDAIGALGRLEPAGEVYRVAAPAVGFSSRVEKVLVKVGDRVKVGQPIAVMDNYTSQLAAARQAEAQYLEAQARLDQVKAGAKRGDINAQRAQVLQAQTEARRSQAELATAELAQQTAIVEASKAEAEFKKAEWDYERYRQLQQDGAIAMAELKTRELTYTTKRQELEQAQKAVGQAEQAVQQQQQALQQAQLAIAEQGQRLDSVSEVRPTDLKEAQAQVLVAQSAFEKAKADLDNAVVKSKIDGQVLKVYTKDGEGVNAEKGLMDLGRTDQMFAVAEVDENYISKVRVGSKARIKSDAFSGEITGSVTQIDRQVRKNSITSSDPTDKQDSRVVEVKIRLDDSKPVAGLTNLQVKVAIEP